MVEVNRIGNYGYYPQATAFTAQRREYRGPEDFQPGFVDPQAKEKVAQRKKNLMKAIGVAVLATGAFLFFKKTNMGKNLIQKFKDLFKGVKSPAGSKTTEKATEKAAEKAAEKTAEKAAEKTAEKAATVAKTKKAKVKPKAKVVSEQVDLVPNKKVKVKNGGGKETARKIRHNEKQIIKQKMLNEEAEAFTTKDLDALQASLGPKATAEETAAIAKNNRVATTSLADVMKEQGIVRTKNKSGRVVLEQTPKAPAAPKAPVTPAPVASVAAAPVADNAAKIAEIEAKIAKNNETIKMWKGMRTSHLEKENARLLKELDALKGNIQAAA